MVDIYQFGCWVLRIQSVDEGAVDKASSATESLLSTAPYEYI